MKHFKQNFYRYSTIILLFCIGLIVNSCNKDKTTTNNSNNNNSSNNNTNNNNNNNTPGTILDYKNSNHRLFVGYLVGDGNDPYDGYNPANAPDSADYLEFFAGRDSIEAHWRTAQAIGTKIVVCHFISDAYFDGSIKDPATQVAGYVNPAGFDQNHATTTSTYEHWAKDTYNKEIVTQKLDGIDLDIESGTFGGDVPHNVANAEQLVIAIAKYYGPNCTECTTMNSQGKKPVFFYDTDGTSGFESTMYTAHQSNYNYVLFQSYTTGNHAWGGSGTASFSPLVATYGLNKLIFLVNGDSFIYPDGHEDATGGDAKATSDLYSFANWVTSNNGTGVGVYRMSRDYNHTPKFGVSKKAIQLMNPAP
jgi:hypothetical protein